MPGTKKYNHSAAPAASAGAAARAVHETCGIRHGPAPYYRPVTRTLPLPSPSPPRTPPPPAGVADTGRCAGDGRRRVRGGAARWARHRVPGWSVEVGSTPGLITMSRTLQSVPRGARQRRSTDAATSSRDDRADPARLPARPWVCPHAERNRRREGVARPPAATGVERASPRARRDSAGQNAGCDQHHRATGLVVPLTKPPVLRHWAARSNSQRW